MRTSAKLVRYVNLVRPASLLIDQRKILFYKKIRLFVEAMLCCGQFAVCILMRYRDSLQHNYDISPGHSSYFDVKRTFWSFFVSLLSN